MFGWFLELMSLPIFRFIKLTVRQRIGRAKAVLQDIAACGLHVELSWKSDAWQLTPIRNVARSARHVTAAATDVHHNDTR